MPHPISIDDFRSTLRVITPGGETDHETIYTYWNNSDEDLGQEEILHLKRRNDGGYHLEIANVLYEGSHQELEEVLYQWALDEGWFD